MTMKFQGVLPQDALSRQLAIDPTSLQKLKADASQNPQAAAKQAASQFEALLMGTMLKTMRETHFDESEQSNSMDTYQGMADQQLVQGLCARGGMGLGDMIYRQLLRQSGQSADASQSPPLQNEGPSLTAQAIGQRVTQAYRDAQETIAQALPQSQATGGKAFASQLLPHARQAAQQLGVAPECVVAHAALESGWGKRAIRNGDGTDSHNLFGIKAGSDWHGKTATVMTTEYSGGVPQKKLETFRSYGSYSEAFSDYAQLLKSSPRYRNVLNQGQNMYGFAHGLQSGGYATDPRYARKLVDVAASLAQQVAGA
ncbi:flagellar assembly peptidoglycan hydrolase FlgJ [Chromobacterium alticapitis]|uniref:Peptidoglycan hydrolase FlgJ n=1 Tax=Chromobacterium alticapitis TaxID=2073169 RepID=A0A2S5DCP7_9NEIS|nr:flagellar assembly peptidoglycan hydrolase FlgJ [Chromobacterium alticapitis]POZ60824.1 flagellar assembly peptidoglycan hydrolase FlgJ [Chromobacterium alticapitis]